MSKMRASATIEADYIEITYTVDGREPVVARTEPREPGTSPALSLGMRVPWRKDERLSDDDVDALDALLSACHDVHRPWIRGW